MIELNREDAIRFFYSLKNGETICYSNLEECCEIAISDMEKLQEIEKLTDITYQQRRAETIDEFIEWLYMKRYISFHEKSYMKEWFLTEQLKKQRNI